MSKRRNPNFTDAKLQTLLDEVEKSETFLFSKLSNVATNGAKKRALNSICSKINADHKITVDEIRTVRKKWSTHTSNAKSRLPEYKENPGRLAVDRLLKSNTPIYGILFALLLKLLKVVYRAYDTATVLKVVYIAYDTATVLKVVYLAYDTATVLKVVYLAYDTATILKVVYLAYDTATVLKIVYLAYDTATVLKVVYLAYDTATVLKVVLVIATEQKNITTGHTTQVLISLIGSKLYNYGAVRGIRALKTFGFSLLIS
ncbi:unnamed protein product [Mytilus coruscus]|uniref:Myb/SANT-like DNA-binding domain-containing protein n=1 Tax=Mytilus coruscus TaxID=42192 RepID=A0A6J8DHH0_MYTCO|nr:unnamed protein product [Mytilus coruscus]